MGSVINNENTGYIKINVVEPPEVTHVEYKSPGMNGEKMTEYKETVRNTASFSEQVATALRNEIRAEDKERTNVQKS